MRFLLASFILCIFSINTPAKITTNQFTLHGLSQFSEEQQTVLTEWVKTGVNATRKTLGVYPTPLAIHLHAKKSNQPVPWAHTMRDHTQSVHLYVDARFPLNKFVDDWTIYHELAHMAFPYLGSQYAWFSEGFASYMQYQIMHQANLTEYYIDDMYRRKITPHLRWFNSNYPADQVARRLMDSEKLPAAYWGSAYFFLLADQQLREQRKLSLTAVVRRYQRCCRADEDDLETLVKALDKVSSTQIFSDLLNAYLSQPAKQVYPRKWPK